MTDILMMAKEVEETTDHRKAAQLVQSGNWLIVNAAFHGEDISWVLIKIR